jgi:hypothetical protein
LLTSFGHLNVRGFDCDIPLPLAVLIWAWMERTLTAAHDLEEIVDLFAIDRSSRNAELMPIKIATLPLRKAVVLVIEDWSDDKFRQLSATIQRRSGPAIRSLDDIKHLYDCAIATPRCCAKRFG